nr:MAG TPA: hypothetical protein [Caudoviricetes sp.]
MGLDGARRGGVDALSGEHDGLLGRDPVELDRADGVRGRLRAAGDASGRHCRGLGGAAPDRRPFDDCDAHGLHACPGGLGVLEAHEVYAVVAGHAGLDGRLLLGGDAHEPPVDEEVGGGNDDPVGAGERAGGELALRVGKLDGPPPA